MAPKAKQDTAAKTAPKDEGAEAPAPAITVVLHTVGRRTVEGRVFEQGETILTEEDATEELMAALEKDPLFSFRKAD